MKKGVPGARIHLCRRSAGAQARYSLAARASSVQSVQYACVGLNSGERYKLKLGCSNVGSSLLLVSSTSLRRGMLQQYAGSFRCCRAVVSRVPQSPGLHHILCKILLCISHPRSLAVQTGPSAGRVYRTVCSIASCGHGRFAEMRGQRGCAS